MRRWTLIFIIFVWNFEARAREIIYTNPQSEYFFIEHQEGQITVVEQYYIQKGHFQRLLKSYKFISRAEAEIFKSNLSLKLSTHIQVDQKLQTEDSSAVIWEAQYSWSTDWEKKYSEWIEKEVNPSFFKKYGIATDCADVAISLRWIFARINKLPMASTLAGSMQIFTHESLLSGWAKLPTAEKWFEDKRFLTALNYVLDNTYTHSLIIDSYPIAINAEVLTPGTHHLTLHEYDSGHTTFVIDVGVDAGGVVMMASTTPREVRELWTELYAQYDIFTNKSEGGFLKIRWPIKYSGNWQLVKDSDMPGFSLEQYDPHFSEGYDMYSEAVEHRLGITQTPEQKFENGLKALQMRLEDRVWLVKNGFEVCQIENCDPGSANYEAWSTPQRDSRIVQLIERLDTLANASETNKMSWEGFQFNTRLIFDVDNNIDASMYDIIIAFAWGKYSSDPRDKVNRRWGLNSSGRLDDED